MEEVQRTFGEEFKIPIYVDAERDSWINWPVSRIRNRRKIIGEEFIRSSRKKQGRSGMLHSWFRVPFIQDVIEAAVMEKVSR